MKFAIWIVIGCALFLATLSVSAKTLLETFDRLDLSEEIPGLSVQPEGKLAVTWAELKQAID